jgi:hypothetical protein
MALLLVMIVDDAHSRSVAVLPPKDDSPLIVDADRVEPFQGSPQGLQVVAGRHSQISELGGIVQIKQLPASRTPEGGWELAHRTGQSVIKELRCETIAEALDHSFDVIELR